MANLSKIAEETNNAVVITDKEGKITWVNTAFHKITGYQLVEVENKTPGEFLQGPDSDPLTIAVMKEKIKRGEGFDVEVINYTKEAKPYWMHIQSQPQFDDSGILSGFFAIQTIISERKRLEKALHHEVAQQQKRITSAMLTVQEKERSELSKELHDNVNQILTTVKLYLEMIEDVTSSDSNDLAGKAKGYVMNCINEIRQISKRLAVPEEVGKNLEEAIKDLIDTLFITRKIAFDFKHYGLNDYEPKEEINLSIYRVCQEHFTNIIRHAEASKIQVSLTVVAGKLSLLIIDNGKGFDVTKKRKGVGLYNMYNRIETLNGNLEIKSKEGEGCTLLATLCVNNEIQKS